MVALAGTLRWPDGAGPLIDLGRQITVSTDDADVLTSDWVTSRHAVYGPCGGGGLALVYH